MLGDLSAAAYEAPPPPTSAILERLEKTQAMMAQLLMEREESTSFGTGSSSSGDVGIKGAAMVSRNRDRFFKNPVEYDEKLTLKAKERVHW